MANTDNKSYGISRESASSFLGISTRTIDRYIKSGKLTYKKVANKVLLNKNEISKLKEEFSLLRQEVDTEILWNAHVWDDLNERMSGNEGSSWASWLMMQGDSDKNIDQKIEKFFLIFNEKEKQLEDKNRMIFMLQQRISELEVKLQNMIALPDYNQEKQQALVEKEKLEYKIKELSSSVKSERIKNMIYISVFLLFVWIAMVFFLIGNP